MSGRVQGSRGARTLTVSLRVHTDASYDYEMPAEAVLARAAAVGSDAAATTGHDSIGALPRAFDIVHEYGAQAVPGIEVSTAGGHLLAFGVGNPPATRQSLSEATREARGAGGLAVVPHPFQTFRHDVSRRATRDVDIIKMYNTHTLTGSGSGQARRYTRRQGLPGTGGSDAHRPALVGQTYTAISVEADGGVTTGAILEGIRVGRIAARGTRTTTRQYLRKYVLSAQFKAASLL